MSIEYRAIHDVNKNKKNTTTLFNVGEKLTIYQEEVILDLINIFIDINKKNDENLLNKSTDLIADSLILNMI